jgi:hypothetical protein
MGKPFSDLEKQVLSILASGGNPLQSNNQEVVISNPVDYP